MFADTKRGNQKPWFKEEQKIQWPKKRLGIPKGKSEAVNRRRTSIPWPKENWQTMIYKRLHSKLKIG
jgi:hypothetical protein